MTQRRFYIGQFGVVWSLDAAQMTAFFERAIYSKGEWNLDDYGRRLKGHFRLSDPETGHDSIPRQFWGHYFLVMPCDMDRGELEYEQAQFLKKRDEK